MSVCVSSSLSSGMTSHVSHLHMTSALSMMHPFQNHQMPPSTSIDMTQHNHQTQPQSNSHIATSNENDPNPEMLLALIARNKTLEGKEKSFFLLSKFFQCRRKMVPKRDKILSGGCV